MIFSRFVFLVCICFALVLTLPAQTPLSNIQEIDLVLMPQQDNAKLLAASRSIEPKQVIKDFATPITTQITPLSHGNWESLNNGKFRWRVRIASPTAHSLNFGFADFYLPSSASFYIYDRLQKHVVGPINASDNDDHGQWWSPLLPFDEVVLEILIDPKEVNQLRLTLDKVNHDFTAIGSALSGSCNLDVLCGAADGYPIVDEYRDIISSVGMYTLNGIRQCSGVLINNVRQDCTPYFLTANHCEINTNNAASVVIYWNYQNSFCRQPGSSESGQQGDGRINEFSSGTRLLANYSPSDFALLLLDDDPSAFNPFFAGWDVESEIFDTTLSIHHPSSEEKRISFDFDRATFLAENFWVRVEDWDIGTTEGGSSGAPIFSTSKHIIGQLNGGEASCGNSGFDDYGALKLSWEGGGTKSSSLRQWLDPDNTGTKILGGRACSNIVSVLDNSNRSICLLNTRTDTTQLWIKSGFDSGVNLTVEVATSGVTVTLDKTSLNKGEVANVYINFADNFAADEASFVILASDESVSSDITIEYQVFNSLPAIPSLSSPVNGASNIGLETILIWNSTSSDFIIELSLNSDFSIIEKVYGQLNSTRLSISNLQANTTYYWRVRALNPCGLGEYSDSYSFTVGDVSCMRFMPDDLPKIIGTEATTISSSIEILEDAEIVDVNVLNIEGKHTWISDLTFRLTSPSGTSVDLAINPCDDENDFFISFDDESANVNLPCPLRSVETFRPIRPLSRFDGESTQGTWRLDLIDDAALDGGTFESWTLELCTVPKANRSITLTTNSLESCDDVILPTAIIGKVNNGFLRDITITIKTDNGSIFPAVINPNPVPVNTEFIINIDSTRVNGYTSFSLIGSGEELDSTAFAKIQITAVGIPTAAAIISPLDQSTGIAPDQPVLKWEIDNTIQSTSIQVSQDPDFIEILIDTIVVGDSLKINDKLLALTTYYWRITHIGTCENSPTLLQSFTTDMNVSVDDPSLDFFSIYPNPMSSLLYIDWNTSEKAKIHIYSLSGQRVLSENLKEGQSRIDVSSLSESIYIYQLVGQKNIAQGKLFVIK